LTELDTVSLIDPNFTDATDEVKAELGLATTLDRPSPEDRVNDVSALDGGGPHVDSHEEALPYDHGDDEQDRKNLQPTS